MMRKAEADIALGASMIGVNLGHIIWTALVTPVSLGHFAIGIVLGAGFVAWGMHKL